MSTILFYTSPARGHLYPIMDVAVGLRLKGHRVIVQTLAAEADAVEAAGIEHRAIAPAIEAMPLADYQLSSPIAQLRHAFDTWCSRAPHEVEDLRAALDELRPDALVIDANTLGAAAFAETSGLPWSLFLPYCLPVPSRDAPAFGPGFAPPRGWPSRLRDRLLWRLQSRVLRAALRRLNALRAEVGASVLKHPWSLYERPEHVLYLTAEPFEYPRRDWPDNVRPLGPGLWAPPGEAPAWLDALPEPRVLVSVSTELQVVVPWGRDQSETARRVEVSGAGVRLPRRKLSPARLRAAVREALRRTPAAERVASAFRDAHGTITALRLIEEQLPEERIRATAT